MSTTATTNTTNTPAAIPNTSPNVTPAQWAVALLQQINTDNEGTSQPQIPIDSATVGIIEAWVLGGEGSNGSGSWDTAEHNPTNEFNPLNIETTFNGVVPTGSWDAGSGNNILEFANWNDGVVATAGFIESSDPDFVPALQQVSTGNLADFTNILGDWETKSGDASYGQSVLNYYQEHLSELGQPDGATAGGIAAFLPFPNFITQALTAGNVGPSGVIENGSGNLSQDAAAAAAAAAKAAEDAAGVGGTLTGLAGIESTLTNGSWWKRLGIGAIGVILVLIGILLILHEQVSTGGQAAATVAETAAIA